MYLINPIVSLDFIRVRLIHLCFERRTCGGRRDIRLKGTSIEMRGSRELEVLRSSSTHVALKGSYNGCDLIAQDASKASDGDPTTAF